MVISFMLMSPRHDYDYFDPTSMENRIWVTGSGTCRCDADGSMLCLV
jgi:hypothetical protein